MPELEYSESIVIAGHPDAIYELVSDITWMGEWSPICKACWWDDDGGPQVGNWFTGRNETPDRVWETRSQVVVAEPGREFAFTVGQGFVRWGYRLEPDQGGTRLTESWQFLPAGIERFHERYGADADTQIAERSAAAQRGIPLTLAAIKATAETE